MPGYLSAERAGRHEVDAAAFACPDCSSFEAARRSVAGMGRQAAELHAFQDEPPQMPSGSVGKAGYLHLGFRHDEARGRTVLADMDRRVPLLAQKALYWEESQPGMACVIIIAPSGCVVQGDRLALDVEAGPGSCVLVTSQSAAKVHSMDHGYASQMQSFRLGEEAYLEYMPDQLILHRHSRYLQDTFVTLPASASFVYGELMVPGRRWHHEDELFGFDIYSAGLRVSRPGGREEDVLFEERLVLEPEDTDFRNVGVMGGFTVLGSVYAFVPERHTAPLKNAIGSEVSAALAWGASILPHGAGLALRVLGHDAAGVRAKMRGFHSLVREAVLGRPLPPEFLWR